MYSRCSRWLATLGGHLEDYNLRVAAAVDSGELAGPGLDEHIVSLEQSLVQRLLRAPSTALEDSFANVQSELDLLLNPNWLAVWHICPLVRWYARVLGNVRDQLQSPIRFASQSHREKIGMALVVALCRDTGSARLLEKKRT